MAAEIKDLQNEYRFTNERDLLILLISKSDQHGERLDRMNGTVGSTCDRVGKLEQWRSWMAGGMALFGLICLPVTLIIFKITIDHLIARP